MLAERGVSLVVDDEGDVELFEMPGWSLIYWPDGLCAHDQRLAEALSAKSGALVSSCNLYDDDLWEHALYRNGVELNRYRSVPDYHGDERKPAKLLDVWGGKPAVIAEAFGIDVSAIERYFEPEPPMDDEQEGWQVVDEPIDMDELNAKAYPDDEVEKSSPHLFTEFWRKVGITLPSLTTDPSYRFRLGKGYGRKLLSNRS
ncbi:MAG: hypothetical protein II007_01615 [Gammaproteobacteria bacterium]|nr:hypothetical protein [Gammaproteobacteria bacterium]